MQSIMGLKRSGKILIEAETLDEQIKIAVTDDGEGIDPSLIDQIFSPGFSTARQISKSQVAASDLTL